MKYRGLTQPCQSGKSLTDIMLTPYGADGAMYVPERLPRLPQAFFKNFGEMTFNEVAYVAANALFGEDLGADTIKQVVERAFNFPIELKRLDDEYYVLELFHGPTLTFKDYGARFMAQMMRVMPRPRGKVSILVSTCGNTGCAAANAFAGIDGVEVYILFPHRVAGRQLESQFTTVGGNVHALEVQGTIDDCNALVAQAFADRQLRATHTLTTANSANIVRLLPQIFFYLYAIPHIRECQYDRRRRINTGIPAGNLGNLCAALMARRMGLDTGRIIAAENANNALTLTLRNRIAPAHLRTTPTLAYAADKSYPTNFRRIIDICHGHVDALDDEFSAVSIGDARIIEAVNNCYDRHGYTIDPHTALAYAAVSDASEVETSDGERAVNLVVGTAHPAKSLTAMSAITGRAMDLPLQLTRFMARPDCRVIIPPVYSALRAVMD